jgi:hypothetical protein
MMMLTNLILPRYRRRWLWSASLIGLLLALAATPSVLERVAAQDQPTPYQAVISTRTPTPEPIITLTPTRTETPFISQVRVEAKDRETGANIRSAPSTDANRLGNIRPGTFYEAMGRYGKWIQIRWIASPTGLAWVFGDIVNLVGGTFEELPEISPDAVPTIALGTAQIQQTLSYITATPGALQTATAAQAIAPGIFQSGSQGGAAQPKALLPTFTNPPPLVEATLPARTGAPIAQGDLPPIVPIVSLAAIGVAGLLISGLRRWQG